MIPLFKQDERVYDLPVIPGVGDFTEPSFDVSITPENESLQSHFLGYCDSLDEAIGLLFTYLNTHDFPVYADGSYKLSYTGKRNPEGKYLILLDFGDVCHHGTIAVSW